MDASMIVFLLLFSSVVLFLARILRESRRAEARIMTTRGDVRPVARRRGQRCAHKCTALLLAATFAGCIDAASDRLAELPVMTTTPDGVVVVERLSGSELGGWPNVGPTASVTYRVVDGEPEAALARIREIAGDTGWDLEDAGYVRGSLQTDDGPAQLSAYNPAATDEIILTVWR